MALSEDAVQRIVDHAQSTTYDFGWKCLTRGFAVGLVCGVIVTLGITSLLIYG